MKTRGQLHACGHYIQKVICNKPGREGGHWGGGSGPQPVVKAISPHAKCDKIPCPCPMDALEANIPRRRARYPNVGVVTHHNSVFLPFGPDFAAIDSEKCLKCLANKKGRITNKTEKGRRDREKQDREDKETFEYFDYPAGEAARLDKRGGKKK